MSSALCGFPNKESSNIPRADKHIPTLDWPLTVTEQPPLTPVSPGPLLLSQNPVLLVHSISGQLISQFLHCL
ncbi:hypothetical protein XENTR_v10024126 [Xenopus tropicalis]|nr:hypothetical protein XENTR_v10024126 [Xenopus tropicalis]